MHDNDRVIIFDTTLRDGEQSPGISLTAPRSSRSPSSSRGSASTSSRPASHRLARRLRGRAAIAREVDGPVIAGLARAHAADIERAADAVREAQRPRIHTFISTSDIHIEHQLQSTRAEVLGQARAAVAHAKSFVDDVEFSPMDATRADPEFTAEVLARRSRRARPRSTSRTRSATRCRTSTRAS